MFTCIPPAIDYCDPWTLPLNERIAGMMARRRRVAYFYELADTSTFRYRAYNMVHVLNACSCDISAGYFFTVDIPRISEMLEHIDVIVLCRFRYTDAVNRLVTRARILGCRVVFDVDDLVFDPDYLQLILQTLDQDLSEAAWDRWFAYIGRLNATMRLCDRMIVTNPYFAERAARIAKMPIQVVRNFLNAEQIELSHNIMRAKEKSGGARDGHIHLSYFSGSPTHNRDFRLIRTAVANIMDRHPQVRFCIVGFLDPGDSLARHYERIDRFPLQDFLNLQRLMGTAEINLVPLQDNVFTNCKSELKYFEAAIVGAVTIATPTYTYRNAIDHGRTGYLAPVQDWESLLETLLADFTWWKPMAARAAAHAEEVYSWETQLPAIETALFG